MAANSQQLDNVRKLLQQRQTTQPTTGGAIDAVRQQLQARKIQPTEREQRIEQGLAVGIGKRAKPTIVGQAVRAPIKALGRIAATARTPFVRGEEGLGRATLEEATLGTPLLGNVKPIPGPLDVNPATGKSFGPKQAIATGLEIGGTFAPAGGVGALGRGAVRATGRSVLSRIGAQATQFARGQAITGAAIGAGTAAQEEGSTASGIAGQGLLGGGLGLALGRGGEAVEPFLRAGTSRVSQTISDVVDKMLAGGKKGVDLTKSGAGLGTELALGTKIKEAAEFAFENPHHVERYASGQRTIKDLGTDIVNSTQHKADTVMDDLFRAKKELPKFQLDKVPITNNIKSITGGTFLETLPAKRTVKRLEQIVAEHTDWTPEGLLNLNTKIDNNGLFKVGVDALESSNAVVRDVRREIKSAALELVENPRVLGELKKASDTIDKLGDLGYVFKTGQKAKPDQMNKAIDRIAKDIDDPNKSQDAKELMSWIRETTGFDMELELNALRAFRNMTQEIQQGNFIAAFRQALGRVLRPVAIEAGKLAEKRGIKGATSVAKAPIPKVREGKIRERLLGRKTPLGPAADLEQLQGQLQLPAPAQGTPRVQLRGGKAIPLGAQTESSQEQAFMRLLDTIDKRVNR